MSHSSSENPDQVHDHLVKPLLKPFFPNQSMEEKRISQAAREFHDFLRDAIDDDHKHLLNTDQSMINQIKIDEIQKLTCPIDEFQIKTLVFELKTLQSEEERLLSHFVNLSNQLDPADRNSLKRIKDYFEAFHYEMTIRNNDKRKRFDMILSQEELL